MSSNVTFLYMEIYPCFLFLGRYQFDRGGSSLFLPSRFFSPSSFLGEVESHRLVCLLQIYSYVHIACLYADIEANQSLFFFSYTRSCKMD